MIVTTTPNEIERLVAAKCCPICKGKLDPNIDTFGDPSFYICSQASCLSIEDHYWLAYHYTDPKKIKAVEETIDIIEENTKYRIIFRQNLDKVNIWTTIELEDWETDQRAEWHFPQEKIFDFKRYNKKKWLKELKTSIIFA